MPPVFDGSIGQRLTAQGQYLVLRALAAMVLK